MSNVALGRVKSTGQLGKAIQRPAPLPRSSQQVTQQTEQLTKANLVLVVAQKSDNPAILDAVHKGPGENLDRLLDFSHLWDELKCDGADLLCGSSEHGVPGIRQMSKLPMFFHSKGDKRSLITWAWLEETIALRSAFADMDSQKGDFSRVVRGLHTLFKALKEIGQDRLHQFVRSLEALIFPEVGKTKGQVYASLPDVRARRE